MKSTFAINLDDTLRERAMAYAKIALRDITDAPWAYGINEPWSSINEWIDFELDGDAGDVFATPEERDAITQALWDVADLDTLNAPFKEAE